jgi:hypothetical protein
MVTSEPAYLAQDQPQASPQGHYGLHDQQAMPADTMGPGDGDSSSATPSSLTDSEPTIKCSAVHTLERDMPDYDYSDSVRELRRLVLEHAEHNPGTYSPADLDKCRHDDWYLSRFLLRNKMDVQEAFGMLTKAMRFNHESLANHLRPEDFPAEFYQLGGLIPYGHDRKGNKMLYLRVRIHRKTPEITSIVQAFMYYTIKRLDDEAKGRGKELFSGCRRW